MKRLTKSSKILIVGLGLIGGSYAEALTDKGYEVGAVDIRKEAIDIALERGFIAHGMTEITEEYVSQFDIIVFSLYPEVFKAWIGDHQRFIKV